MRSDRVQALSVICRGMKEWVKAGQGRVGQAKQAGRKNLEEIRDMRYSMWLQFQSQADQACVFLGLPGRFVNCFQLHVAAHFGSASLASPYPSSLCLLWPALAFFGVINVQRKRKFLSHSSLIHSAFLYLLFVFSSSLSAPHFPLFFSLSFPLLPLSLSPPQIKTAIYLKWKSFEMHLLLIIFIPLSVILSILVSLCFVLHILLYFCISA